MINQGNKTKKRLNEADENKHAKRYSTVNGRGGWRVRCQISFNNKK